MSKNPENWWKLIANIDREILLDFWTTWEISMKFSGTLWPVIILRKLTTLPPPLPSTHTHPSHFRVKTAVQRNLAKLIRKHLWWGSLLLKLGNITLQIRNSISDFFSVNFDIDLWDFMSILEAITPAHIRLDEGKYINLPGHASSE